MVFIEDVCLVQTGLIVCAAQSIVLSITVNLYKDQLALVTNILCPLGEV